MSDDLDAQAEAVRTAWETEHLDDPADDAETTATLTQLALIPGDEYVLTLPYPMAPPRPGETWRDVAAQYQRVAHYWREQYLDLLVEGRAHSREPRYSQRIPEGER